MPRHYHIAAFASISFMVLHALTTAADVRDRDRGILLLCTVHTALRSWLQR
jgi:hypothetical protein